MISKEMMTLGKGKNEKREKLTFTRQITVDANEIQTPYFVDRELGHPCRHGCDVI